MSPRRAPARLARLAFPLVLALAAAFAPAAAVSGALAAAATDQASPEIPEPTGYVNDLAGVMDDTSRARLEAFLDQVQRKTGAEFAVLTVRSTAPLTPSEYKVQVFQRWGIGKQGEDNGLLMLVALDEHKVRFETGYGLEGTLPDGFQSRVFRNDMRDHFRQGDYAGGITAGVLRCAARIAAEKGVTLEWNGRELRYDRSPEPRRGRRVGTLVLLVVGIVILFMVFAGAGGGPRRRGRGGPWIWPGPWGGGMGGLGGSGGGFGGGATFGGFGGGASGGGGGGGSW